MLAIRLEVFRGRLVNTFFIYDYIKIADSIKNNVISLNFGKPLKASNIYINGMLPMPLKEVWHFSPADPLKFDTFRYTFVQVFNDDSMLDINVNKSRGEGQEDLVYTVKDVKINNSIGMDIEPFEKDFSDAVIELKLGRHKEASIFFQKAIERRPFLINYVLSGYRLEDLKWITNGRDMRQWIADIISHYNRLIEHPLERDEHISNILNKEIDDYIECFFYLSYLKHFYGEFNESEYLFSQIRFLESDYNKVSSWLSGRPVIKSNKNMLAFLRKTNTYEFRNGRNTRVFLKFIAKLILNKDAIKQDEWFFRYNFNYNARGSGFMKFLFGGKSR